MKNYIILHYEIYEYPQCPADHGNYYGKTPVLDQAKAIVRNAKVTGRNLFLKAVCSDGEKRYM